MIVAKQLRVFNQDSLKAFTDVLPTEDVGLEAACAFAHRHSRAFACASAMAMLVN